MNKIELRNKIVSAVEELLDYYDISIPDANRQGDPDEARLYGESRRILEAQIEDILMGDALDGK